MSPSDPRRGHVVTGMGRAIVERPPGYRPSGSRSGVAAKKNQRGERFSAGVVVLVIFASTAISVYDLYLLVTRVVR